jgi:hypothetical protein
MTHYKGATIVDIARLAGLNDDLTCNIWHPLNAVYRVPLASTDAEAMAVDMAAATYGAIVAERGEPVEPEQVHYQCLVDARRMVGEPDYARLFGDTPPQSLDGILRWRRG